MNITDEQRAAWVKALRSGDYVQGQRYLKRKLKGEIKYCCLGVLLDTLGNKGRSETDNIYVYNSTHVARLPIEFGNSTGRFFDPLTYKIEKLADLNDGYGFSFNDIAKIVETCQFIGE